MVITWYECTSYNYNYTTKLTPQKLDIQVARYEFFTAMKIQAMTFRVVTPRADVV